VQVSKCGIAQQLHPPPNRRRAAHQRDLQSINYRRHDDPFQNQSPNQNTASFQKITDPKTLRSIGSLRIDSVFDALSQLFVVLRVLAFVF
jgi:hypothetical protein